MVYVRENENGQTMVWVGWAASGVEESYKLRADRSDPDTFLIPPPDLTLDPEEKYELVFKLLQGQAGKDAA